MNQQYTRLIIVLVAMIGIAGLVILYLSWPLLTGKTVILATMPVDPFDILRGQYIIINYEINNIPAVQGGKQGGDVYVTLKEDENKIWRYQSSELTAPKDATFIKGAIKSIYSDTMVVEYGIEQFFFERNADFPQRDLSVEVKISSSGQARISQLLYQGKPINITYQKVRLTS